MTRISKGSQEVIKCNTELPMSSVLNPNEGMRLVPHTNDIPLAYRCLTIGTFSLGLAMCSPVANHPLPPLPVPCTEGCLTQFFPPFFQVTGKPFFHTFFNHKE